jgi:2-aminoadipate transaminase
VSWSVPGGGMCFWVGLPPGLRSTDLYEAALEQGVAFAPGQVFFPEQSVQGYMRLAFAGCPPESIERGIKILGELLNDQMLRRQRLRVRALYETVPMV